jgi:hypothetical protein
MHCSVRQYQVQAYTCVRYCAAAGGDGSGGYKVRGAAAHGICTESGDFAQTYADL